MDRMGQIERECSQEVLYNDVHLRQRLPLKGITWIMVTIDIPIHWFYVMPWVDVVQSRQNLDTMLTRVIRRNRSLYVREKMMYVMKKVHLPVQRQRALHQEIIVMPINSWRSIIQRRPSQPLKIKMFLWWRRFQRTDSRVLIVQAMRYLESRTTTLIVTTKMVRLLSTITVKWSTPWMEIKRITRS